MTPRTLLVLGAISLVLAAICVATIDVPCSRSIARIDPAIRDAFAMVTEWLDTATLRGVYHSLLPMLMFPAGLILLRNARLREWGVALALSGAACLTTHGLVNLLKPPFGRLRPRELNAANDWTDRFFVDGNSMPSGHTAFYVGLFLALAVLAPLPRVVRCVVLLPALFIVMARVMVLAHFASDVLAAAGIACAIVAAAWVLQAKWLRSPSRSCAP